MKEILETIILSLVDNKDAVQINELDGEKSVVFEVKVAEEDMGKVIGRQGRLAKSIRTLVKSIAGKEHKKVTGITCGTKLRLSRGLCLFYTLSKTMKQ